MRSIWHWLTKHKSIFGLTLAGVLLLLAQSAFWINHTIFDKATFSTIVTSTINTEQSRQAIAATVVGRTLQDRPVIRRIAGDKATQLISGLLGTDLAAQTINTVVDRSYTYLTSENPESIEIDLLPIKTPLAGLVSFAESQGREVNFDVNSVPDSIMLFDASNLPNIYGYSVLMLWLGPLFWLGSFGLFAIYMYRGRRVYAKRIYIVGTVIILVSFVGLLFGPLLPPPISALVPVTELRSVVGSLVGALLAPFTSQMYVTIASTAIILAIFSQRFTILHLFQKVAVKPKAADSKPVKTTRKSQK